MANNYVYILNGKAYINLTNKCRNACGFCIRNSGDDVAGTPLWLDREPTSDDVLKQFDKLCDGIENEVVFCGFGEPTENLDALKTVAVELKSRGYSTRLNTNGLGSIAHGRDIAKELAGIIDVASVSLNAASSEKYLEITNSEFGLKALPAVIDFAEACKANGIQTVFTVVDTIGKDEVEKCKALCAEIGIPLRVREYIDNNYN